VFPPHTPDLNEVCYIEKEIVSVYVSSDCHVISMPALVGAVGKNKTVHEYSANT